MESDISVSRASLVPVSSDLSRFLMELRIQVPSSSCYFISTRSDPNRFILRRRTGGHFGPSRQNHEEKDYSPRQDSLEEPS
uniref:Uncharacterized protein n=1 Tax=Tanacetum cinerariifolium TaxID=118510 RepID=A0A699SXH5_TANCI|nr:hypothetical protein [Tanacetum cinerariifolium]